MARLDMEIPDDVRIVARLCQACIDIIKIMTANGAEDQSFQAHVVPLMRIQHSLVLWDIDHSVANGNLDSILQTSRGLQKATLVPLRSIIRILVFDMLRCVPLKTREEIYRQRHKYHLLLDESEFSVCRDDDSDEEHTASEPDEDGTETTDSEESGIHVILQRLSNLVRCLFDLNSALECPAPDPKHLYPSGTTEPSMNISPYQADAQELRNRFPSAPQTVIEHVSQAESNTYRERIMQQMTEEEEAAQVRDAHVSPSDIHSTAGASEIARNSSPWIMDADSRDSGPGSSTPTATGRSLSSPSEASSSSNHFRRVPKNSEVQLAWEWSDVKKFFTKALAAIGMAGRFLQRYFNQTYFRQQIMQPDSFLQRSSHQTYFRQEIMQPDRVKLNIFPIDTIPPSMTSLFVGRENILASMAQWLRFDRPDRNGVAIYTLCGIGGVGKTELAQEYANSAKNELDAVFWVTSEKKDSIAAQFSNIAVQLHLEGAKLDGDPANNRILVQDWFRTADESWLLILDNVEDFDHIKDYLPSPASAGSVIVTTRYPDLARRLSIHRGRSSTVDKLGEDQAKNLFLELLFREEDNSTTAKETQFQAPELPPQEVKALDFLLKELDGLPLGIQQMVASIKHGLPSCTHNLAKFVERYQRYLPRLLEKDPTLRPHRLNTLWAMTFNNMRTDSGNPYAWDILGTLCCLQPDDIPKKVFLDLSPSLAAGNLEFCSDEFYVDDGISFLRSLGLVDVQGESDDRISLHRLIQVAFLLQKDLEGSERQTIFESASVLINDAFPKQIEGRMMYGDWEKCQEYILHAISLYDLYRRLKNASLPLRCTEAFAELMTNCAWYMNDLGEWDETLELTQVAAEACKEIDESGLIRAHLLNTESQVHFSMNNLDKCREALEESQRIRERHLDPLHEELANTYMNLGNLEAAEGNYDKSLEFYNRSNAIRERIPNSGAQLMVGLCHLNLARALLWKGDFERSRAELDKSQSIMEAHGGKDYHDIVFIHFMRGNLYFEQGDLDKARESYQVSLDMLLAQLSTHPRVAAIYFKIGTIHYLLGRWQEAMVALSKALRAARNREENTLGEQARIIRRQAQVLESVPPPGPSVELLRLVDRDFRDSDTLRAIADRLRFRVAGIDSFQPRYIDKEEEIAFNKLVGFFDR